jgi:hypothetical protein
MHTQDNLLSEFLKEANPQATLNAAWEQLMSRGLQTPPAASPPRTRKIVKVVSPPVRTTGPVQTVQAPRPGVRAKSLELLKRIPRGGKALATVLGVLGVGGGGAAIGTALAGSEDDGIASVDYGKHPELTAEAPTSSDEALDPVLYGTGGAALGGISSAAWGKLAGKPDLARDLIAALGGAVAGAGYATVANNKDTSNA